MQAYKFWQFAFERVCSAGQLLMFTLAAMLFSAVNVHAESSTDSKHLIQKSIVDKIDGVKTGSIGGPVVGAETGLRLPRFVSIKRPRVNVRRGPSRDHKVAWMFTRKNMPIEIIDEFDNWRRIRDSEGEEGWIHHSLLSGQRYVVVAPWSKGRYFDLYAQPGTLSKVTARLEAGVVADLRNCNSDWCQISGSNYRGWLEKSFIWGVYATESVQ